jgi:hypothetical protein
MKRGQIMVWVGGTTGIPKSLRFGEAVRITNPGNAKGWPYRFVRADGTRDASMTWICFKSIELFRMSYPGKRIYGLKKFK